MSSVDPLALVYAGLQIYKVYRDDKRFDAEMEKLRAKNLDPAGLLAELHAMRDRAAAEAHAAVDGMKS
jgi:hypothetical protein